VLEAGPTIEDDAAEVAAAVGSRALLPCDAVGLPRPAVTWLKDGVEVDTSDSRYTLQRTGSLQVSALTVSDSGLYECIATNDAGTARREVVLSVLGTSSSAVYTGIYVFRELTSHRLLDNMRIQYTYNKRKQ